MQFHTIDVATFWLYEYRGRAIGCATVAPSLGIPLYNSRAVSTLGYIAQIYPFPNEVYKTQKSVVQGVYHTINNTLSPSILYKFKEIGLVQPHSLHVLSYAARFRAARHTITVTNANKEELDRARNDVGPVGWLGASCRGAKRVLGFKDWSLPPAVDLMFDAQNSFQGAFGDFIATAQEKCRNDNRMKLQKAVSLVLLPKIFPMPLVDEFVRNIYIYIYIYIYIQTPLQWSIQTR